MNKVIEYDANKFLGVAWDNNKFIFIDHSKEQVISIVQHPSSASGKVKNWGLQMVPDFDVIKCPFVIARDNTGFVLINVRTIKVY